MPSFLPVALQFLPLSGGTITGALTVTGLITGQGGETLTNGNLLLNLGNVNAPLGGVNAAGPVDVQSAGSGLAVKEGANAKQGTSVLAAGSVVVANTSVTANSRIMVSCQSLGTVAVASTYDTTTRVVGTSFTIHASQGTDTSTVFWEIFEPG